jgi:hypothetical protein
MFFKADDFVKYLKTRDEAAWIAQVANEICYDNGKRLRGQVLEGNIYVDFTSEAKPHDTHAAYVLLEGELGRENPHPEHTYIKRSTPEQQKKMEYVNRRRESE